MQVRISTLISMQEQLISVKTNINALISLFIWISDLNYPCFMGIDLDILGFLWISMHSCHGFSIQGMATSVLFDVAINRLISVCLLHSYEASQNRDPC